MKKALLAFLTIGITHFGIGQPFDFPLSGGQSIKLDFRDANIIDVRGWDQEFVRVEPRVKINLGQNDDAYKVTSELSGGQLYIQGFIEGKEDLPEIIQIKKDDQLYHFMTDDWNSPEIQKFYEEQGEAGVQWVTHGVAWEIDLTISVPKELELLITSRHGLIDVEGFEGTLTADSRHGGVDVALTANASHRINLSTKWGEIFSNLDLQFETRQFPQKGSDWNVVKAHVNSQEGSLFTLKSRHGNIYLRKDEF